MQTLKKVVVVIPVHKKNPESAFFANCTKILNNYDFCLIAPKSLDMSKYEELLKAKNKEYSIKRFNDKYFKDVKSYSKFCLKSKLYKAFRNYEYMFLLQEDGFVFKDELEYWCNKGFDYIGAPLFEGYENSDKNSPMIEFSGNGGVSLRKISSFIKALEKEERHSINPVRILSDFIFQNRFRSYKTEFQRLKNRVNEDVIITQYLRTKRGLEPAPNREAIFFSFEVQPERLYRLTEGVLPFACHAYRKYNPEFWKQFIPEENFLA
ncbi:MAG: DUF5672 family protein [Candidatus Gastranaerophilales bacterium]|nr:DUF5672 family protein [Candidatus Gastranaerophilales bacterium]